MFLANTGGADIVNETYVDPFFIATLIASSFGQKQKTNLSDRHPSNPRLKSPNPALPLTPGPMARTIKKFIRNKA